MFDVCCIQNCLTNITERVAGKHSLPFTVKKTFELCLVISIKIFELNWHLFAEKKIMKTRAGSTLKMAECGTTAVIPGPEQKTQPICDNSGTNDLKEMQRSRARPSRKRKRYCIEMELIRISTLGSAC